MAGVAVARAAAALQVARAERAAQAVRRVPAWVVASDLRAVVR
ncbi:MAG: hypothetical protein ACJ8BC_18480 [Gemmatimonadales bacterium]